MYCSNLRKRQKQYKIIFYCAKNKRYITSLETCKSCSNFNIKLMKPIPKTSKKKIKVTNETYQKVFERDKGKCQLCGTNKELQLHHINGRGKSLTNSVDNCIMLCGNCHLEIVHKNQKKYRPILLKKVKENNYG